jgi:O-antigen/teichoic acid export membrane protein
MVARVIPANLVPPNLRRSLATVSLLGAATGAGAVIGFLTQTLLARELGPAAYGLFASSVVTVTMIAPLAGFGLTQFRLKVYGVEGWAAHRWIKPSLRFTIFTTLLAFAVVIGWALTGAPHNGTRFTLLVLTPLILSALASDLVGNKLRLEDRYQYMAVWQLFVPGSRLLVAILLLLIPHLTNRFVAIGYSITALLVTLRAVPHMRALLHDDIALKGHGPRVILPDDAVDTPSMTQLWSSAWAYGVVAVLYPVFFQISTVLLKYLANDTQAGLYGIGLSVMTAVYLIPVTIYQKFLLAKLHRWSAHDKPKFLMVYRKGNLGMFALGLLIGVSIVATSPWVVPIVFGEAYRPVVPILMLLATCVPIRFLAVAMGSVLLTENHMRFRVYAMGLAALVVIGMNLVLIPRFSAMGAASATVMGECVLLLVTYYCVRRFVRPGRA